MNSITVYQESTAERLMQRYSPRILQLLDGGLTRRTNADCRFWSLKLSRRTASWYACEGSLRLVVLTRNQIIVDSVASPIRQKFDRSHLPERQGVLSKLASQLKYLAKTFGIPVLVTNQVTTKFGKHDEKGVGGRRLAACDTRPSLCFLFGSLP